MTLSIAKIDVLSPTSIKVYWANGVGGFYDVQVSIRDDFQFCVCPIVTVPLAATTIVPSLNAATNYYVRGRNRSVAGVVEEWGNVFGVRTAAGPAQNVAPAPVMIEPARLVVPEPFIQISDTGALPGYPASNLGRDGPTAYRFKPFTEGQWFIEFNTAGGPIDTVALLNTNIPDGTICKFQAGNVKAVVDADLLFLTDFFVFRASANLPGRPGYHGLITVDTAGVNYTWWRIIIQVPLGGLLGDVMHAEHLIVGRNRVTKNHALEKTDTPAPMTTVDRRRSGMVDRVRGRPMRKVDFELQMLTEAQYETIYGDLWRYENEAVLVVPNAKPGAFLHDRILFGDLTGGRIVNPSSPRYNRSFTINSII